MSPLPAERPDLDLVFARDLPVPPAAVWAAWTRPALIPQWFCPPPWRVLECEVDLRPGGIFRAELRGPDEAAHSQLGCWLEIVPETRLVWTDALLPGYRPAPAPFVTLDLRFAPLPGGGTQYRALVMHADAATRERHEGIGFADGWSRATEQLVALCRTL